MLMANLPASVAVTPTRLGISALQKFCPQQNQDLRFHQRSNQGLKIFLLRTPYYSRVCVSPKT